MKITTTIDVKLEGVQQIMDRHGLQEGGPLQQYLAQRVLAYSDPYTPMLSGVMKNTAFIESGGRAIIYDQPYARMMWYGKLMVDPVYGYGGLYSKKTGKWFSRPGVQKVVSSRDIKYHGSPIRGPKWVTRMWADKGEAICLQAERWLNNGNH